MEQLIQALQIFLKYGNPGYPTICGHNELIICGIKPDDVSMEDIALLHELGFFIEGSREYFMSFKYGSA